MLILYSIYVDIPASFNNETNFPILITSKNSTNITPNRNNKKKLFTIMTITAPKMYKIQKRKSHCNIDVKNDHNILISMQTAYFVIILACK